MLDLPVLGLRGGWVVSTLRVNFSRGFVRRSEHIFRRCCPGAGAFIVLGGANTLEVVGRPRGFIVLGLCSRQGFKGL